MNWKIVVCLLVCASMKHAFCASTLRGILIPRYASRNMDMASLEEGPGYETYGHQQMQVARQRGIVPLIDTIREQDKYGNDGRHIRLAGNTFLNIFEDASASLSQSSGEPSNNTVNILAGLNPMLEELGDKLGGLA